MTLSISTPRFGAYSAETKARRKPPEAAATATKVPTNIPFEGKPAAEHTPQEAKDFVSKLNLALKANQEAPNWHYTEPKNIITSYEVKMFPVIEQAPLETVKALDEAIGNVYHYTASESLAQAIEARLAKK